MWELLPLYEKWQTLKKFFKTRRLVLTPGFKASLAADAPEMKDILSPWKFNAMQSAFSSAPALAVVPIILSVRAVMERHYDASTKSLQDRIGEWANEAVGTLIVPFSLMLAVLIVRHACLKKQDQNLENRRRAGRLYLYFDGALGLYSQMFASLAYVLWTTADQIPLLESKAQSQLAGLLYLMSIALWIWQTLVTIRTVPRGIFVALGYTPDIGEAPNSEIEAPWTRYRLAALVGVPLVILASKFLSNGFVIAFSRAAVWILNRGRD